MPTPTAPMRFPSLSSPLCVLTALLLGCGGGQTNSEEPPAPAGTGGGGAGAGGSGSPPAGPPSAAAGRVVLSEIMYHPVGEDDGVEHHEFVELHNPGDKAVAL